MSLSKNLLVRVPLLRSIHPGIFTKLTLNMQRKDHNMQNAAKCFDRCSRSLETTSAITSGQREKLAQIQVQLSHDLPPNILVQTGLCIHL